MARLLCAPSALFGASNELSSHRIFPEPGCVLFPPPFFPQALLLSFLLPLRHNTVAEDSERHCHASGGQVRYRVMEHDDGDDDQEHSLYELGDVVRERCAHAQRKMYAPTDPSHVITEPIRI